MSAWQTFRSLNRRRKFMLIVSAPLWLPIALAAWLDADEEPT